MAAARCHVIVLAIAVSVSAALFAEELAAQAAGAAPQAPRSAREAAPVDFTGYWVSVISEDWRWRMITPPKGDYANIPVNPEARRMADTWDPAKDEASGEQCKGYAAPAIMREPGRLHITWKDDNTLQIEIDAGVQARLLHFAGAAADASPSWQGHSAAKWEQPLRSTASSAAGLGLGLAPRAGAQGRSLEVVTTRLRPGYLRKNGVPYSANAVVNEYFDLFDEPDGTTWFVVTTVVQDSQYLNGPWVTTSHFKREADGSKWSPMPCSVR